MVPALTDHFASKAADHSSFDQILRLSRIRRDTTSSFIAVRPMLGRLQVVIAALVVRLETIIGSLIFRLLIVPLLVIALLGYTNLLSCLVSRGTTTLRDAMAVAHISPLEANVTLQCDSFGGHRRFGQKLRVLVHRRDRADV